jgi:hypothetical protein
MGWMTRWSRRASSLAWYDLPRALWPEFVREIAALAALREQHRPMGPHRSRLAKDYIPNGLGACPRRLAAPSPIRLHPVPACPAGTTTDALADRKAGVLRVHAIHSDIPNTAWTATSRWFLGMIIAFTVVRLVLATVGIPRTRIRLFQPPIPVMSSSSQPIGRATSGNRDPDIEMEGPDRESADEASRT